MLVGGEMSPADLTKPFNDSCCDGGACADSARSAQPCGCDAGAGWVCRSHREASFTAAELDYIINAISLTSAYIPETDTAFPVLAEALRIVESRR